jgi:tetratricopeptide (TPR) repeat protein
VQYDIPDMRLLASIVLFLVLAAWGSNARAADRDTPEYQDAVNLGLAEFEERNFLEARVHFARAHSLNPSARTLRALGMVQFELKDYVQSVALLQDALRSTERALDGSLREKTEKLLERARSYIASFDLDIEADTRVSVDGQPSDLGAGSELVLPVGEHALEFKAPGHITDKRTLHVQGGEHESLRVRLVALKPATDKQLAEGADSREKAHRPVYKSPWLWVAVGVVIAGAAAGTAIALTRDTETRASEPYAGTSGAPPLVGLSQAR